MGFETSDIVNAREMKEEMAMDETTPERDIIIKKFKRLVNKSMLGVLSGDINKSLKYIMQAENLLEEFQGTIPSELEQSHCDLLHNKVQILENQGYLTRGFEVAQELLSVATKRDNKLGIFEAHRVLGNLYRRSNKLDKAFKHLDRAIALIEELLDEGIDYFHLAIALMNAIDAAVMKNDMERTERYFTRLEEIHELKPNNHGISLSWKIGKIFFLSTSMRPRDIAKGEDLCDQIIQDKYAPNWGKITALQILCKLLFVDLRMTNNNGVIDEIKALFPKMFDYAQGYESTIFLVDYYTIQGKLSLLTFDFKMARRMLTQARRIAERHGYFRAVEEISRFQEGLEQQLTTWEQLKRDNAHFSERMELARVNDHFTAKFGALLNRTENASEEDITVYKNPQKCVVCKGVVGGFNIYMCSHCKTIYCKTCVQAVIDLENECWSCETPIDILKPVKHHEPDPKIEDIDESKKPKKREKSK